ncbi:hypothetical protein NSA42_03185 [Paeniclostridium sordellii]|uniref:hypothetical protein n=1 Tax=Paraclostridium sordellii TaxID=1505 RepID=UPI002149A60D|nr:hypothetical protein [Paeniclostridium sordellii]MCR1848273.1 hypothetical protein [Paeniclostridium sordellii]
MFNEEKIRREIKGLRDDLDINWILSTLEKFIGKDSLQMIYPKNIFDRLSEDIEIIVYSKNSIYKATINKKETCVEVDKIDKSKLDYLKIKQYSGEKSLNGNLVLEIYINNGEVITLNSEKDSRNMFVDDYKSFIYEVIKNF